MSSDADFVALVHLAPTEVSGRTTPIMSGYRPTLDMGIPSTLNDAALEFIDIDQLGPGESGVARFSMLAPDFQIGRLYPGFKFELLEGNRKIGTGAITEVLNGCLLQEG